MISPIVPALIVAASIVWCGACRRPAKSNAEALAEAARNVDTIVTSYGAPYDIESWTRIGKIPHAIFYGDEKGEAPALLDNLFGAMGVPDNDVLRLSGSAEDIASQVIASFYRTWPQSGRRYVVIDQADDLPLDLQRSLRLYAELWGDLMSIILICNSSAGMGICLKGRLQIHEWTDLIPGHISPATEFLRLRSDRIGVEPSPFQKRLSSAITMFRRLSRCDES